MSGERDDTTRYLAAAAHLDDRFADRAIREFLTEPTRAAPPVVGVRAGAVLAEAVAARARRKLRDTLLVTLLAGVLVTLSLSLVVAWLLIAMSAFAVYTRNEPTDRRVARVTGGALVATALIVVLFLVGEATTSYEDLDLTPAATLAVLLLVALLTVLLVDEFVVWHHIEDRFPRDCLLADPDPAALSPQVRRVFLFGAKHFLSQLRRLLHRQRAGGDVPVTVAVGHRVFVGAGEPHEPWSLAVPLRPRPDARVRPPRVAALYERVSGALGAVRVSELVVVSAAGLIENLDRAGDFIAGPAAAPYPLLRGQRVRELRDQPLEWARYHLCFEVDAGVSIFLHLAVRDGTLRVEWTPCVLPPVRAEYRAIDTMSDSPLLPLARAVLRFLMLPMTVPDRLRTVCSVIRPNRRSGPTPDRYGVPYGLRELAADPGAVNRPNLKVFENRLTRALAEELAEAGYEVGAVVRQSAGVIS
jgi:hypothetical protein